MDTPREITDARVERVELIISTLLRLGVGVSLLIILFGTVLSFVHHPGYFHSPDDLHHLTTPGAAFPHTMRQVGQGLLNGQGQAFVALGLIVLIATPIMRVAVSIFAFVYQRDRIFVLITALVLALLLLSFVLGRVE